MQAQGRVQQSFFSVFRVELKKNRDRHLFSSSQFSVPGCQVREHKSQFGSKRRGQIPSSGQSPMDRKTVQSPENQDTQLHCCFAVQLLLLKTQILFSTIFPEKNTAFGLRRATSWRMPVLKRDRDAAPYSWKATTSRSASTG